MAATEQKVLARIKIPRDHPRAAKILELAQRLATRQKLASGLVVEKLARPEADLEFLAAIGEFVDVEAILAESKRSRADLGALLGRPEVAAGLLGLAVKTPFGRVDPGTLRDLLRAIDPAA